MKKTFYTKVYEIVSKIPQGSVATYQDIARLAGNAKASRAVGTAMKRNPDMTTIPCHRIVGSDGKMHGYAFGTGSESKMQLLKMEGIHFIDNRVDLQNCRWKK